MNTMIHGVYAQQSSPNSRRARLETGIKKKLRSTCVPLWRNTYLFHRILRDPRHFKRKEGRTTTHTSFYGWHFQQQKTYGGGSLGWKPNFSA